MRMHVHALQRLLHRQFTQFDRTEKSVIPLTLTGYVQFLSHRHVVLAGMIQIQQADGVQVTAKKPASGFCSADQTRIKQQAKLTCKL